MYQNEGGFTTVALISHSLAGHLQFIRRPYTRTQVFRAKHKSQILGKTGVLNAGMPIIYN